MKIKILQPLWGHEHLPIEEFLEMTRLAGYDGVDTWIPADKETAQQLARYVDKHNLILVAHQHEAEGATFDQFKQSFLENLKYCASFNPVLINSHTGRDWFSMEQHFELIDVANEFSYQYSIPVAHETHRGRMGSAPFVMKEYFAQKDFLLTADFSHWTCVTESLLDHFEDILSVAIERSRHIHTRVGFEQGPQIPDPRTLHWKYALEKFLSWWDRIVISNIKRGTKLLTMTTEFGPPPYMPVDPVSGKPVANQFDINCFMKDLLRERYAAYIS